ncbi:hypothetical protein WJX72_000276 [[Myrmecia] bisecta]|uniref:Uncharacterized protein n=1 Tax=[Myrmecia] bisecta TaxID=41462 RepID=A0AAW1Q6G7_9CHLO
MSATKSKKELADAGRRKLEASEQESEQLGDRPPSTSYAQLSGSYLGKPGHPAEGNSRAAGGEQTSTSYAQLSDSILGRQSGQHQSKGNSNVAGHTATSYGKDFSTLQQYIDDLTQEKFELMRGLEQQRRLAETLAAENMALTEDFNRQGAGFQDVKKLLERYKAEIAAQQMALQSVAAERDACRGGVTESAERIKAVASEVVALEETVLKLRSANLKLERETEQAKGAERKALHLLQTASTDRGSLQAMIEALQEEKRTLSAKLRRATVGSHLQAERPPRDASTQTAAAAEVDTGRLTEVAASAPETQASTPAPAAAALVSDKRHMLGALEARLAQVAQLQAANGELRYKLESMTQRFELAVAQSSFAAAAAAAQADGEGYVKSANVTPQPMPRRPLRAPREEQRSGGVLTWLAHLVAPPPPQRLTARRLV